MFIIPKNGGRVCGVEMETTVVPLCSRRLNCWPINSDYRFFIQ